MAKRVARQIQDGHMIAYRCPMEMNFWHIGHLAKPIIHGISPKNVIYDEVYKGAA